MAVARRRRASVSAIPKHLGATAALQTVTRLLDWNELPQSPGKPKCERSSDQILELQLKEKGFVRNAFLLKMLRHKRLGGHHSIPKSESIQLRRLPDQLGKHPFAYFISQLPCSISRPSESVVGGYVGGARYPCAGRARMADVVERTHSLGDEIDDLAGCQNEPIRAREQPQGRRIEADRCRYGKVIDMPVGVGIFRQDEGVPVVPARLLFEVRTMQTIRQPAMPA